MKISRLIIPDFQQFKDFDLDLTYPEGHEKAGEPLDKVCFIGGNGTGKSTLLQSINYFLLSGTNSSTPLLNNAIIKIKIENKSYYWVQHLWTEFSESIETDPSFKVVKEYIDGDGEYWNFQGGIRVIKSINSPACPVSHLIVNELRGHFKELIQKNSKNLLIYSPAEASHNTYNSFNDLPNVTLNESMEFLKDFPYFHLVSNDTINEFWRLLIYHLKKRENDFRTFESQPENQIKTVKEVRELFEKEHPDILKSLSDFWNKILAKAGLEFDYENAKNPIQLTDNLQAYIRLKSTKEHIGYNQLSTGIRNFIFKLGHIYALYFNRNIESGFLLVDEPENSLFPDFLYDLVDVYTGITKNTQIFMATHNPIIAAQFQPYERFILEFEEGTGHVKVRRGTTPVGDDPNDILIKDFGIRSILGREGVTKWERYIELKTLIPLEHDPAKKNSMIEEFMQIGSDYNFAADAVS